MTLHQAGGRVTMGQVSLQIQSMVVPQSVYLENLREGGRERCVQLQK